MKKITKDVCSRIKTEVKLFYFLDGADAKELEPYLECGLVEADETLWEEHGECDYMVFVISGCLKIKKETEFEGKDVIVGLYGPGSIAGELCILDGSARVVSATAYEPTELLILSRENFERLNRECPDLMIKLLKGMLMTVSLRLRKSFDRLAAIF